MTKKKKLVLYTIIHNLVDFGLSLTVGFLLFFSVFYPVFSRQYIKPLEMLIELIFALVIFFGNVIFSNWMTVKRNNLKLDIKEETLDYDRRI